MLKRPSEHRLTREERVAVVVAILVAVGVHVALFLGGSGIGRLVGEGKRRERTMVIRRIREVTPPPDLAVRVPDPRRVQVASDPEPKPVETAGAAPPKDEPEASPRGTLPLPPKPEITTKMEEDLQASPPREEAQLAERKPEEPGSSAVSVVTDLQAAAFTLSGPVEYRGTGTYWIRRGAPPGTYRIAFSAVDGFGTPPPQTKELAAKGQIVFVGKYRRSTEVVVESNEPAARFTIYRPDGRPLDMDRPGRAVFDDLPLGNYTVVFKDLPGRTAPAPMSRTLAAGGALRFFGEYWDAPGSRSSASEERKPPAPTTPPTPRDLARTRAAKPGLSASQGAELDRRVQVVVKSYPATDIEEHSPSIAYPEVAIRKSNFQQGWCQVYLILKINGDGEIEDIVVERPRAGDRPQYEALIQTVEAAVRGWDYDKVSAEVHVDARFYVE